MNRQERERQREGAVGSHRLAPRALKLGMLNVRGCSTTESKRCEIGDKFLERKMDVLALCETKMKGKGEITFGDVVGRGSGVERGRAREGVALILSEWMLERVVEWKEVSSRLMWVRVRIGRECWAFVSAYGPGSERSAEEREEFWNEISRCVEDLKRRNYVIVLGDLNAKVGNREVAGVTGKFGVPGENENGEYLLNMCAERELMIGNTIFGKKKIYKYTWVRVVEGKVVERALLDYVLVDKRILGKVQNVQVRRGVAAGMSDHFLVEVKLMVGKSWGNRARFGCKREVIRVEGLKEPEKGREYRGRMEEAYDRVKDQVAGQVEEEYKDAKEALVENAKQVCGKRYVGGGIRRGSEWWNEDIKRKVEQKRRAYVEWLQCRTRGKYERYKDLNKEVKRMVKKAKMEARNRWGDELCRAFEDNKKKFWKVVKREGKGGSRNEECVRDENGQLVKGGEARKRWAGYYENLLNAEVGGEAVTVANVGVQVPAGGDENEREISREEVEKALRETRVGKAPGMDGVKAEMIKEGGTAVIEWLIRIFRICFSGGVVPVDWALAIIVPLFKGKGSIQECSNYRGISLLSVVGKLYARVLINRIRDKTEGAILEIQSGFRRGRGCADQTFIVRQICEKYLGKGKEVFFAFLDLEKAYDKIDRAAMWNVLRQYGIGGRLLKAVQSLYKDSKACVRVCEEMSEWFQVKVGLRQGCVMSPWLFNLYIDGVVREVNGRVGGHGLRLLDGNENDWEINQLLFADDTVVVADSERKLCQLVTEFGRVCERRKLRVNVGKSKVMRCTRNGAGVRLNVTLNGEVLEEVDQFKYLGSVIAANGGVEADVRNRVNEGCKVLGAMKGIIGNRGVNMNVKRVLHERVIVPTVTYGSELWGMRVNERQKLNVFEMKCLRSMAGVSRLDRLRNEEVRERTGVRKELASRVDGNVLRWFGHVERMDNERLLKRVLNAGVEGRNVRGRPRFGWMEGVRKALSERNLDVREARERARNRNEWRAIVNS